MVVGEKLTLLSGNFATIYTDDKELSDFVTDAHLVDHGIDIILDEDSVLVSA